MDTSDGCDGTGLAASKLTKKGGPEEFSCQRKDPATRVESLLRESLIIYGGSLHTSIAQAIAARRYVQAWEDGCLA